MPPDTHKTITEQRDRYKKNKDPSEGSEGSSSWKSCALKQRTAEEEGEAESYTSSSVKDRCFFPLLVLHEPSSCWPSFTPYVCVMLWLACHTAEPALLPIVHR